MRPLIFIASLALAFAFVIGLGFAAHDPGVGYMSAAAVAH